MAARRGRQRAGLPHRLVHRVGFTQVLVVLVIRTRLSPFWLLLVVLVAAYVALVELVKRRFEPRA